MTMTLGEATQAFQQAVQQQSQTPRLDAEVLMAHLLGIGRALQMVSFWKKPRISMCQST